jgi:peptidoglycan/LPS O-acetylase OafA/YrhL
LTTQVDQRPAGLSLVPPGDHPGPVPPGDHPAARRGPVASWRALAARVDAATPPTRDRAIDGLRALAIGGVVVGHWFVMATTVGAGGALDGTSPLLHLPGLAPASWVLQMLGLFFLVGGYQSARSLERARARGQTYRDWLGGRLLRLARPVAVVAAALGAALPLLALAGVPAGTLRTVVVMVAQPLWFVGIYGLVTALTPVALALQRRLGVLAALPPLLVVAVVDLLRYGPWREAVPGLVGLVNVLPGWSFAFLLGVAWAAGRIDRRAAAVVAAAGAALGLLLVLGMDYPASMVGVPGAARVNSHPPSLLVPALAALQSGLAILLGARIGAWLRRPGRWAAVALANLSAMTIFTWHQVATLALAGTALVVAPAAAVPGLLDAPDDPAWLLHRLAWFPVYAAVLAGFVALVRRFEGPWRGVPRPARAALVLFAAGFGVYAAATLAGPVS